MIVADTHAFVWWISDPDRLSAPARDAFTDAVVIGLPAIACWEIALRATRRRIAIDEPPLDWLYQVTALPRVAVLPLTIDVAAAAANLRDPIRDPADRLIVATALQARMPLVTKDHKIIAAGIVPTIW
ncbi:MAG TPA: type II toxin-antitoxin system VapC family toxin [Thermoanaerobaculia bacterium]|nr:type II toxin-antitoxin system VapC family toxin [Thermoanaerobaculia bacterium]